MEKHCLFDTRKHILTSRERQHRRWSQCPWWTTTIWILDWIHPDSQFWNFHPKDICGEDKDLHKFKLRPDPMIFGQRYGRKCPKLSKTNRATMGYRKIQAGRCTPFLRIITYFTCLSRMQENTWKRIRNPPYRAKHQETPKRRHWIILCQPGGGESVQKQPYAPKKKSQAQLVLTNLMLVNLDDAVWTKATNKGTKSILQSVDTISWVFAIWFKYTDSFSKSNESSRSKKSGCDKLKNCQLDKNPKHETNKK